MKHKFFCSGRFRSVMKGEIFFWLKIGYQSKFNSVCKREGLYKPTLYRTGRGACFFLLPAFSLVLLYFDGIVHSTFRSKFLAIYYSSSTEKVHVERKEQIQVDTFVLALFLLQTNDFQSLFCLPFYRKMWLDHYSTQQNCDVQFSFKLFWWNCKQ